MELLGILIILLWIVSFVLTIWRAGKPCNHGIVVAAVALLAMLCYLILDVFVQVAK